MIKFLQVVIISVFFASCVTQQVDDCSTYDYSDCITTKPDSSFITIKFSTSKEQPLAFLKLYRGFIDDNVLIEADSLSEGIHKVLLPVDQYYSVLAIYSNNGDTMIAVDGDKLKIWKVRVCDSICWNTNQPILDVRKKR